MTWPACWPTPASSGTGPRSRRRSPTPGAALSLPDGLAALVWQYAEPGAPAPRTLADVPASTPAAKALSADLRRRGFRFTGPVTAYATMQACGLVNDHLADCVAWER